MTKTGAKSTHIRNVLPRRMYKERGQLSGRMNRGKLLEKKKDYKKRTVDFKEKRGIINKLSLKAQLRNPDEFYHKMQNARFKDGTHQIIKKRDKKALMADENKDLALVNLKRQVETKKAERLQNNLHMMDMEAPALKVKFVNNLAELKEGTKFEANEDEPTAAKGHLAAFE